MKVVCLLYVCSMLPALNERMDEKTICNYTQPPQVMVQVLWMDGGKKLSSLIRGVSWPKPALYADLSVHVECGDRGVWYIYRRNGTADVMQKNFLRSERAMQNLDHNICCCD